jgi:hypothetical protein
VNDPRLIASAIPRDVGPEHVHARAALDSRPDATAAFVFVISEGGREWGVDVGSASRGQSFATLEQMRSMLHDTVDALMNAAEPATGGDS